MTHHDEQEHERIQILHIKNALGDGVRLLRVIRIRLSAREELVVRIEETIATMESMIEKWQ